MSIADDKNKKNKILYRSLSLSFIYFLSSPSDFENEPWSQPLDIID